MDISNVEAPLQVPATTSDEPSAEQYRCNGAYKLGIEAIFETNDLGFWHIADGYFNWFDTK